MLKVVRKQLKDLHADPANANRHPANNLRLIANSLTAFGQVEPLVVQAKTGRVIGGNGRLEVMLSLGMKEADCVELDIDDHKATTLAIALNRTAKTSEWDDETLASLLQSMDGAEREVAGFTEAELGELLEKLTPDVEVSEDEVPEPPPDPITKTGDLWLLGEHRLLCGDSTRAEDVARLMDGCTADICFTSPPYALGKSVALRGNTAMAGKQRVYDKHEDNPDEWAQLMNGWWNASAQAVAQAWLVNVQPLAGNKRDLMRWINDRVNRLIDIITWDKGHSAPQMAAGVLASRYEWIICMGKPDASRAFPLSSWRGTLQSVYEAPAQRNNDYADIHAATMPVHVPAWIMGTLCDKSKSVYEPFCGTGTTLIAAEQLGRKCYGMEISPQYCDVIVKRWETLTGRKAERAER